ncbi:hypothetical protein BD410DRAFT_84331 [Rickenella mellea]|uniref:Uncharacterized protein n=1 Tax=Rickenella mellea TaxID=50990 RepID=A0A4Y7PL57_9AGAM|nr:hypothetical protein BD410DRAFT_84331 [Rickenella mellea]
MFAEFEFFPSVRRPSSCLTTSFPESWSFIEAVCYRSISPRRLKARTVYDQQTRCCYVCVTLILPLSKSRDLLRRNNSWLMVPSYDTDMSPTCRQILRACWPLPRTHTSNPTSHLLPRQGPGHHQLVSFCPA